MFGVFPDVFIRPLDEGSGVAPPFSPLDLPGLTMWLDGDDFPTFTLSGNNVVNWADKSGNSNDMGQANPAQQPEYVADAVNNKPSVLFQAVLENFLEGPLPEDLFTSDNAYIFVAFRPYNTRVAPVFPVALDSSAILSVNSGSGGFGLTVATSMSGAQNDTIAYFALPNVAPTFVEGVIGDTVDGISVVATYYKDVGVIGGSLGVNPVVTQPAASIIFTGGVAALGQNLYSVNSEYTSGYIAEIFTGNASLTAMEIMQAQFYLSEKWSETVDPTVYTHPNSSPYYGPDFEFYTQP